MVLPQQCRQDDTAAGDLDANQGASGGLLLAHVSLSVFLTAGSMFGMRAKTGHSAYRPEK
jgi:hypothetical protein